MNAFAVGVPPFVTAVSRFTTAMSALRNVGAIGESACVASPASCCSSGTLEMHVPTEGEDDRFSAGRRALCASGRTGDRREDGGENEQRDEPIHQATIATSGSLPRPPALGVGSAVVRKGIVQLVAIGVVIGIAVTLVAVLFQWLPTSASEEFDRIQDIYWFATIMSIVIFSLVAAVVVYSVWKWRVPPDEIVLAFAVRAALAAATAAAALGLGDLVADLVLLVAGQHVVARAGVAAEREGGLAQALGADGDLLGALGLRDLARSSASP